MDEVQRAGRRDRPHHVRGLRAGGVHARGSPAACTSSSRSPSRSRCSSRRSRRCRSAPRCARCSSGRGAHRRGPLGALLRRVQPRVRRHAPTATSSATRCFARKLVFRSACSPVIVAATAFIGGKLPTGFVPEEDQGYPHQRQLPDAASLQRTDAVHRRSTPSSPSTPGVARTTASPASASSPVGASTSSGLLLHQPRAVGRAQRRARSAPPASSRAQQAVLTASPRRGVRLRAAGHPGHQRRGRLRPHAPGPKRRPGRRRTSANRRPASSRRPGNGPRSRRSRRRSAPRSRSSSPRSTSDKVLKAGCRGRGRVLDAAGVHGERIHQPVQSLRPHLAGVRGGGARVPGRWPTSIEDFWVRAQGPNGDDGAALLVRDASSTRPGPEFTVRFNLFRSAEIIGTPRRDTARARRSPRSRTSRRRPCRRRLRYAWNALSYQEEMAPAARAGPRSVARLRVPDSRGALRELVAAVQRPPRARRSRSSAPSWRSCRDTSTIDVYAQIGLMMLVGLSSKNAILIVEFAKTRLEQGKSVDGRGAGRGGAPAAAHPDDVVRLHLRLHSAALRDGRRRGGTAHPGHGGHLGMLARRSWLLRHPAALRLHRANSRIVGIASRPQSAESTPTASMSPIDFYAGTLGGRMSRHRSTQDAGAGLLAHGGRRPAARWVPTPHRPPPLEAPKSLPVPQGRNAERCVHRRSFPWWQVFHDEAATDIVAANGAGEQLRPTGSPSPESSSRAPKAKAAGVRLLPALGAGGVAAYSNGSNQRWGGLSAL